jgi:gas vesicle protein
MDKREKKGLALGAIVGAVVGVITGILFAPKSGKETRQDIKEATSKAAEKLSAEAHKIQEEALELIAKAEVRLKSCKGCDVGQGKSAY